MVKEIRYPAIYLPSDVGDIWVVPDGGMFRRCFEKELSGYSGSMIIDATGTTIDIGRAERLGWGTPFWGWHPMWNKRLIKIELVMTDKRTVDLDGAKQLLIAHTRTKKGRWTKRIFGSQARLEKLVTEAGTWEKLFDVLMHDQDN